MKPNGKSATIIVLIHINLFLAPSFLQEATGPPAICGRASGSHSVRPAPCTLLRSPTRAVRKADDLYKLRDNPYGGVSCH
jgi:hypothetical protein